MGRLPHPAVGPREPYITLCCLLLLLLLLLQQQCSAAVRCCPLLLCVLRGGRIPSLVCGDGRGGSRIGCRRAVRSRALQGTAGWLTGVRNLGARTRAEGGLKVPPVSPAAAGVMMTPRWLDSRLPAARRTRLNTTSCLGRWLESAEGSILSPPLHRRCLPASESPRRRQSSAALHWQRPRVSLEMVT